MNMLNVFCKVRRTCKNFYHKVYIDEVSLAYKPYMPTWTRLMCFVRWQETSNCRLSTKCSVTLSKFPKSFFQKFQNGWRKKHAGSSGIIGIPFWKVSGLGHFFPISKSHLASTRHLVVHDMQAWRLFEIGDQTLSHSKMGSAFGLCGRARWPLKIWSMISNYTSWPVSPDLSILNTPDEILGTSPRDPPGKLRIDIVSPSTRWQLVLLWLWRW